MDAVVNIGVVIPAEVHHEAFDQPLPPENVKFPGMAWWDFAQRRRPHGRMSSLINPNRFHCKDGISF